jgi:hypothetical protein
MKMLFSTLRIRLNSPVPRIGFFMVAVAASAHGQEVVLHFDKEAVGKPVAAYTNAGVVFTPAHAATRSKAVPRVMFFPHLKAGKNGILNAMADDPIPVKVRFPHAASSVTLVLWGSTGCPARLEAFDADGKRLDQSSVAAVPGRTSPAEAVPTFALTVKAPEIAYVCFSGPRVGEYLAAEEVRFTLSNGSKTALPPTPKD